MIFILYIYVPIISMISPSFPVPKKISDFSPQRRRCTTNSQSKMYRGPYKTSSQIGVYGLYWVYSQSGWRFFNHLQKYEFVNGKDDISFPCAARESLLGHALWPSATLYRGCFSCSSPAEQHHPRQNHSLLGQQTQQVVAEWATLQRFAVQNLLPPVQWPN